jgi:hypothetical protein
VTIGERNVQALAWEITSGAKPVITEKYGGLNNASAYIGMVAQPEARHRDPR